MVKVPPEPECHILYSVGTLSVVRDVGRVRAIWRGTCLTALLPGETVGNTAPIPGQANVTDTLGHSGVPGSRHPYWDCWYGHPRSGRTHLHATPITANSSYAYAYAYMHMYTCVYMHIRRPSHARHVHAQAGGSLSSRRCELRQRQAAGTRAAAQPVARIRLVYIA